MIEAGRSVGDVVLLPGVLDVGVLMGGWEGNEGRLEEVGGVIGSVIGLAWVRHGR